MQQSPSEPLVNLQAGFVVPLPVFNLVLRCEAIGIRLWIAWEHGAEVLKGDGPLTPELIADLKRWKPHVLAVLKYTADDRHLFDRSVPFPVHGPALNGRDAA